MLERRRVDHVQWTRPARGRLSRYGRGDIGGRHTMTRLVSSSKSRKPRLISRSHQFLAPISIAADRSARQDTPTQRANLGKCTGAAETIHVDLGSRHIEAGSWQDTCARRLTQEPDSGPDPDLDPDPDPTASREKPRVRRPQRRRCGVPGPSPSHHCLLRLAIVRQRWETLGQRLRISTKASRVER